MEQLQAASLLETERTRIANQIDELAVSLHEIIEASDTMALDDEHDPDGSTVAFERAQVAGLLETMRDRLVAVAQAEKRLAEGTFGMCEECGQPISDARLEAMPLTTRCVACTQ